MPFLVLLFLILMAVVGYFAQLNPGRILFYVSRDTSYPLSLTALILFSLAVGGFLVMITSGVRQTKALYLNWTYRKRQKKEAQMDALYKAGLNAFFAKWHREAISLFQKVLALSPNHIPTLLRLGEIHRQEKNVSEAIRLHRMAKLADSENLEVLLQLTQDLEAAGQYTEAIVLLKEMIHQEDTNLAALLQLREIYVHQSNWEEAHDVGEKILKLPLSDSMRRGEQQMFTGIQFERGRTLLKRNQTDAARRAFKSAVKMDTNFIPAYVGLAEVYFQEGHAESCMTLLEKGYNITQNVILLHRLEELCLDLGQPDRILKAYQQNILKNPTSLPLKFYLGKLYDRLEMVDQAFDLLGEIQGQIPNCFDLQKILGNLHWRRGEFLRAAEIYRAGLDLQTTVFYLCSCSHQTAQWSGRCDQCGQWNSYAPPSLGMEKLDRGMPLLSNTLLSAKHPAEAVTGGGF